MPSASWRPIGSTSPGRRGRARSCGAGSPPRPSTPAKVPGRVFPPPPGGGGSPCILLPLGGGGSGWGDPPAGGSPPLTIARPERPVQPRLDHVQRVAPAAQVTSWIGDPTRLQPRSHAAGGLGPWCPGSTTSWPRAAARPARPDECRTPRRSARAPSAPGDVEVAEADAPSIGGCVRSEPRCRRAWRRTSERVVLDPLAGQDLVCDDRVRARSSRRAGRRGGRAGPRRRPPSRAPWTCPGRPREARGGCTEPTEGAVGEIVGMGSSLDLAHGPPPPAPAVGIVLPQDQRPGPGPLTVQRIAPAGPDSPAVPDQAQQSAGPLPGRTGSGGAASWSDGLRRSPGSRRPRPAPPAAGRRPAAPGLNGRRVRAGRANPQHVRAPAQR